VVCADANAADDDEAEMRIGEGVDTSIAVGVGIYGDSGGGAIPDADDDEKYAFSFKEYTGKLVVPIVVVGVDDVDS
jgi:hypothetical protein